MKRNAWIALLLTLMLLLSGCASGSKKLAAKVGDREISVTQLENIYNSNSPYASYYGYALTTPEEVETYQDYLLDQLVSTQMAYYQARQAGVTLTDEEEAEAQKKATEDYDSAYQTFLDAAKESGTTDVNAYANKLFTDALVKSGTTVGKMKKEMLQDAEDAALAEKHREALLADVQLSDEDLKTVYDEQLAAQKELFDGDSTQYFTYEASAMYGYGYPILYVPSGLIRVRHILVEDETTADEVLAKLKDGGDFDALLQEYGTDPGMESNPEGYLVGEGANYVEPFLNGALALEKDGDLSDVIQSDYGYHIIKRVGTEAGHEVAYEDVKDTLASFAQNMKDSETYNAVMEAWLADESLVTRYPENYRDIGKSALAAITPAPVSDEAAPKE